MPLDRYMRVIGLAGWSGAGKTTLIDRLIPCLAARGLRVSTVKHAHHGFDVDHPGKDSWRHRQAGATEVLVSSGRRWALIHELRDEPEPSLPAILGHLQPVDLVIVEGYKRVALPKLEVFRAELGKPPLHPEDPWIVAIAADCGFPDAGLPCLDLDDIDGIADALLANAAPLVDVAAAATA